MEQIVRMLGLQTNPEGKKIVLDILEFDRNNPRHYSVRRAKKSMWHIGCDEIITVYMWNNKEKRSYWGRDV